MGYDLQNKYCKRETSTIHHKTLEAIPINNLSVTQ